jgi:hypothetical protein
MARMVMIMRTMMIVMLMVVMVVAAVAAFAVRVMMVVAVRLRLAKQQVVAVAGAAAVGMMMVAVVVARAMTAAQLDEGFRLEGALDPLAGAAESAHQLVDGRIVGNVDHLVCNLSQRMAGADLKGEAGEPGRALGADGKQRLGGRRDAHEAAVVELVGVAIARLQRPLEHEMEAQAAGGPDVRLLAPAGDMIEGHRVDHLVRLDGELAHEAPGVHVAHGCYPGWPGLAGVCAFESTVSQ